MSSEGAPSGRRFEKERLLPEGDPGVPILLRTWIQNLTPEQAKNPASWPSSIRNALQHINVFASAKDGTLRFAEDWKGSGTLSITDETPESLKDRLADALLAHDRVYEAAKNAKNAASYRVEDILPGNRPPTVEEALEALDVAENAEGPFVGKTVNEALASLDEAAIVPDAALIETRTQEVKNAESVEALLSVIEQLGTVPKSSGELISAAELVANIQEMRRSVQKYGIGVLTALEHHFPRAYGLRDAIFELLAREAPQATPEPEKQVPPAQVSPEASGSSDAELAELRAALPQIRSASKRRAIAARIDMLERAGVPEETDSTQDVVMPTSAVPPVMPESDSRTNDGVREGVDTAAVLAAELAELEEALPLVRDPKKRANIGLLIEARKKALAKYATPDVAVSEPVEMSPATPTPQGDEVMLDTVLVPETPEREVERRKAVRATTTIDELVQVIDGFGDIFDGGERISKEDLHDRVIALQNLNIVTRDSLLEDMLVNAIPVRYGLRDKMIALLEARAQAEPPVVAEVVPIEDESEVATPETVPTNPVADREEKALPVPETEVIAEEPIVDWGARVQSAQTFEELAAIAEEIGDIEDATGTPSLEALTARVDAMPDVTDEDRRALADEFLIQSLPTQYGIAARARELLRMSQEQEEASIDVDASGARNPYVSSKKRVREVTREIHTLPPQEGPDIVIPDPRTRTVSKKEKPIETTASVSTDMEAGEVSHVSLEAQHTSETAPTAGSATDTTPEKAFEATRVALLREDIALLEAAYRGNNDIAVARQFGVETFNKEEARQAIERMIAEREAQVHALEGGVSAAPEFKTVPDVASVPTPETAAPASVAPPAQQEESMVPAQDAQTERVSDDGESDIDATLAELREALTDPTLTARHRARITASIANIEKKRTENVAGGGVSDSEVVSPESVGDRGVSPEAVRLFEKTFGITKEHLETVEGFDRLSPMQQKVIFENLSQVALGNIEEESARIVAGKGNPRKSETISSYKRLLEVVLSPARDVIGGYRELKAKKQAVKDMRTGGLEKQEDILRTLVADMVKRGPVIKSDKEGNPVVDLINIRTPAPGRALRNAERLAAFEFNAAAHALAQTPAAWRTTVDLEQPGTLSRVQRFFREKIPTLSSTGKVQENTYAKRETEYNAARKRFEEVLRLKGESDLQIAETLLGIDSRVHQLQTLRTNPDAVAELARISDQGFALELVKRFVTGNGGYMALGAVGRTLGGAALGFVGTPIASSAVAYLRSWNRNAAELRERDRNARAGVVDKKAGALNVVAAEKAEQVVLVNGKEMQNGLTAKLKRLIERAQQAEGNDVEKKKLLAQLRARVEYVHDKQMLQRVDYGAAEGRVSRQVALSEALGEALAYLSAEDMAAAAEVTSRSSEAAKRLQEKLTRAEQVLVAARKDARTKELKKSIITAASFSVAGALIADLFRSDGVVRGMWRDDAEVGTGDTPAVENIEREDDVVRTSKNALERGLFTQSAAEQGADVTGRAVEKFEPYKIARGDTFWNILGEKVPSIAALGETQARENAVANIIKSLSRAELIAIGIESGDPSKIYPGDTIDMTKLYELVALDEKRNAMIERALERFGTLPISTPEAVVSAVSNEELAQNPAPASPPENMPEREVVSDPVATVDTAESIPTRAPLVSAETASILDQTKKSDILDSISFMKAAEAAGVETSVSESEKGEVPSEWNTKEVGMLRKESLIDAVHDQYPSDKQWNRFLNMKLEDVLRYKDIARLPNPNLESVVGRAQAMLNLMAAFEKAGISTASLEVLERRAGAGGVTVGTYLDTLTSEATRLQPETYNKLLESINPETAKEAFLKAWVTPESVAKRGQDLEAFFTERLRATDRTNFARWAQGYTSPFENKSELALESIRQKWIGERQEFIDLLKKYKIPFAPQNGETNPQSVARFAKALAGKITPEEYEALTR